MQLKKPQEDLSIEFKTCVLGDGKPKIVYSGKNSMYHFKVFFGQKATTVKSGDSFWFLDNKLEIACILRGPKKVTSNHLGILLRGYTCPEKTAEINYHTFLPYINGCSTRQIFPPERPGDPTWQLLQIPSKTREQMHHVHSTDRIAFVLKGSGKVIFGQKNNFTEQKLKENYICCIKTMTAHHFEADEELRILAFHVFSTVGALELNHPMYLGTLPVTK